MKLFDLVCPIIAIQGPRKIMMFYTKDRRKKSRDNCKGNQKDCRNRQNVRRVEAIKRLKQDGNK